MKSSIELHPIRVGEIVAISIENIRYVRGVDFELDKSGSPVFPGDYVSIEPRGGRTPMRRRVNSVGHRTFKVTVSPHCDTTVDRLGVTLCGRYHPFHHGGKDKRSPQYKYSTPAELAAKEKEKAPMMHLAIRVPENWDYSALVNSVNNFGNGSGRFGEQFFHGVGAIAASTTTELKQRVTDRIRANPDERWLLLSGNNIMEIDSPPVRCRQW